MNLVLGSLTLLLGPFLYVLGDRYRASREALDGFVLITLAGIVCLHIVPDAWRVAGPASVVFLLLGLGFPMALEAVFSRVVERAHLVVLLLAALGIGVHAVLDGIALLPDPRGAGTLENELALGVILHRIPVGMAIWWALRPRFGTGAAVAAFVVLLLVTGIGYAAGERMLAASAAVSVAFFQSFVAGSLVHVTLFGVSHRHGGEHGHDHAPRARTDSRGFRAGLILGLVLVVLLPHIPWR